MKILVTGGAGFIGSHFIRLLLKRKYVRAIINLDKLTYAGHLENLKVFAKDNRYRFIRGDIADRNTVARLVPEVDAVVNFAAETHVDRSIHDAAPFLHSNVIGTQSLLEAARKFGTRRYLQVSTDEVYGDVQRGESVENDRLMPSSPYSASKAAADHLVLAAHRTHGLPVLITRASNNYGPFQYPEKFLPLFITRALENQSLPLYGDGRQVRDWLHVEDHCLGIEAVLKRGKIGSVYNIGGGRGFENIAVAKMILARLGRSSSLLQRVQDRPGHDRRYALSIQKARLELGWSPKVKFEDGLNALIGWYAANRSWWEPILYKSKPYQRYLAKQYTRKSS